MKIQFKKNERKQKIKIIVVTISSRYFRCLFQFQYSEHDSRQIFITYYRLNIFKQINQNNETKTKILY